MQVSAKDCSLTGTLSFDIDHIDHPLCFVLRALVQTVVGMSVSMSRNDQLPPTQVPYQQSSMAQRAPTQPGTLVRAVGLATSATCIKRLLANQAA